MICNLCPRKCNIDRANKSGYCHVSENPTLARAALHFYEEPCISGKSGSGAIFFSGCNMGCIYCQNEEISHGKVGREISDSRLLEIMFELKEKGALNINLVTPTHYVHKLIPLLKEAKNHGLNIPIIYNTSSYECVESLKALEGLIDVYLPDFKYINSELSSKYSNAPDYPDVATAAIKEMVRQNPECIFDDNGLIKKGVIIRHLILPGHIKESEKVLDYLYREFGDSVYMSIMNQYTPCMEHIDFPNLNRTLTKREYDKVVNFAIDLGITNAYIQEGRTQSDSFIPAFDYEGL